MDTLTKHDEVARGTPDRSVDLAKKSILERGLSLFADVRPREAAGVLLLTLNLLILLGTYYLLKTVRESLILVEGGAEIKAYSSGAQALLLLMVVPLYGWIGTKLNRIRLLQATNLFFALNLLIFFALGRSGHKIGVLYYVWVGIFNVFSVAQVWAFATDLVTEEQGKRLFPILGVGASIGAVAGAWLAGRLIAPVGIYNILLLAIAGLLTCALIATVAGHLIAKREGEREKKKNTETLGKEGGFQLVFTSRYLLLIALLTMILNILSVSGDFIMGKLLVQHANEVLGTAATAVKAKKALIGAFYADYYAWANLCSFLIQAFLVSRIFKYFGLTRSLFALPLLSILTFAAVITYPVLRVVRLLKIGENSTNYSLQNTLRNALFLPVSREAKYKAKAAIETFCVRLGDVLQAAIIYLGTRLHFSIKHFATISLVLALVSVGVAAALFREHRRLISAGAAS